MYVDNNRRWYLISLTVTRTIIDEPVTRSTGASVTDWHINTYLCAFPVVFQTFIDTTSLLALIFPTNTVWFLVTYTIQWYTRAFTTLKLCM